MGAAALPVAMMGLSGLNTAFGQMQKMQADSAQEARAKELEYQSQQARKQAEYQQTMAQREADEVKRRAEVEKKQAKDEFKRRRASQQARMGASGFAAGSPVSSLDDSRLTEQVDDIEARAGYQAGNSLLSGANAAWRSKQGARSYQMQADQARPSNSDQTMSLMRGGLKSMNDMMGFMKKTNTMGGGWL